MKAKGSLMLKTTAILLIIAGSLSIIVGLFTIFGAATMLSIAGEPEESQMKQIITATYLQILEQKGIDLDMFVDVASIELNVAADLDTVLSEVLRMIAAVSFAASIFYLVRGLYDLIIGIIGIKSFEKSSAANKCLILGAVSIFLGLIYTVWNLIPQGNSQFISELFLNSGSSTVSNVLLSLATLIIPVLYAIGAYKLKNIFENKKNIAENQENQTAQEIYEEKIINTESENQPVNSNENSEI
ncbi:MAG: hypothetical protein LBR74_00135 [Eubacterium sp.]|jgi:hypothetical protein|nr:hypothetical protein [Eubacterium sp.]